MHLFSQAGGTLRYNAALGAFVPNGALDRTTAAGAAAGVFDLAGCLADGRRAAAAVFDDLGVTVAGEETRVTADDGPARTPSAVLWRVPDTGTTDRSTQFVDLQRDATVADIARAVDAGMRTVEHIKRYTTIGTAHDQGKTSGVIASGITAELLGRPIDDLGTTTFRPPYTPVAFAALAGRNRGSLFDPERTTARARLASRPGRGLGGRRAVEAPAVLPAARRGHGDRRTAGVRGGPRRRRHHGRLDAGQDRRAGPGRRGVPGPALHEHDEQPEGRRDPLRRDVPDRRHGPRRRDRAAARPGPVPGLHHHRRCGRCPRVDGGLAADRVAAPARARHLGDRAVGDVPGGRPPVAGRGGRGDRAGHLEGGVPVHDVAGHPDRRRAGAGVAGQLLR